MISVTTSACTIPIKIGINLLKQVFCKYTYLKWILNQMHPVMRFNEICIEICTDLQ